MAAGNGHKAVSLAELLALPVPSEDVILPEYDGVKMTLHAVTGLERRRLAALAEANTTAEQNVEFQHELVATSLGGGATAEEVGRLPSTAIDRLTNVAMRLTGLGREAVAAAEAELKATPNGDSG